MIIVYTSIGLVVASLIYLGVSAFKTFKETNPSINELNHTVARVQQKTNKIKVETARLSQNQQELMADINYKKQAISYTIGACKRTFNSFRRIWKLKPLTMAERKKRKMHGKLTITNIKG